jgi:hypothetical protein
MAETGARTRRTRRQAGALVLAVLIVVGVVILLAGDLGAPDLPGAGEAGKRAEARSGESQAAFPGEERGLPEADRPTVAIQGSVVAAGSGDAVGGATVTVENPFQTRETMTDDCGIWRMTIPAPRIRRGEKTLWKYEWTHVSAVAPGFLSRGRNLAITGETATWAAPPLVLTPVAATVSGRVLDPEGRGIPGASIGMSTRERGFRFAPSVWNAPRIRTDAQGRFGPVSVPARVLYVGADAYGWRRMTRRIPVRHRNPPDGISVELVLSALPRVTGCVVDETGRPISGVKFRYPYRGEVVEVTDEKGRFSWPVENPFESEKVWPKKAGYLDLKLGQRVSHGLENRLVLHRAAPVSGRVTDHEGRPAEGVIVSAWFEIADNHQDITDADGQFRIRDVRIGRIELRLRRHGIDLAHLPADVMPGGEDLVLRLPPLRAMTVTVLDAVTGRPLEGTTLVGPNAQDLAVTDARGQVSLPHGEPAWLWHKLKIRHRGYATGFLTLSKEHAGSARTVSLAPLVPTEVTVRGDDGEPVVGAVITWRGEWPHVRRMETTGADGTVVLDLPAEGSEHLKVAHRSLGAGEVHVSPSGSRRRLDVRLEPPAKPPPSPRSRDDETGEIAGTVVGPDGRPVADVTVGLHRQDVRDRLDCQTDGLGRFHLTGVPRGTSELLRIDLPPDLENVRSFWATEGETDLRVVAPGTATLRLLAGDGPPRALPDGSAWLMDQISPWKGLPVRVDISWRRVGGEVKAVVPAGPALIKVIAWNGVVVSRLTLAPGKEVVLKLRPRLPHSLRGVVLDGDGRGAAHATLLDAITGEEIGVTDEKGTIVPLKPVPPVLGPLLVLLHDHAPKMTEPVDLERGADLTIHMRRGGTVRVTVRGADDHRKGRTIHLHCDVPRCGPWRWTGTNNVVTLSHVPAGLRRFEMLIPGRRPIVKEVRVIDGATSDFEIVVPGGAR